MNWGSPKEEAVVSGPHLEEDLREKMRAKEGVRAPEPHSPARADEPNLVRWTAHGGLLEDWSWQGELPLPSGRIAGFGEG